MPTPTTLNASWKPVGFTPTGGSLTTFTRVQSAQFNLGGKLLMYKGDADKYPTGLFNLDNEPTASFESDNLVQTTTFANGTVGVLTATLNDVKNGVTSGGGALLFTLSNAVIENIPFSGSHAQFAKSTVSFKAYSSDGTTSPLVITAV